MLRMEIIQITQPQISNNTVQVGADVFDVNSGRRNISNIVSDLKKMKL